MRASKLLTLLLLAFAASVMLTIKTQAQTTFFVPAGQSAEFTITNGSPKDPYNVCVWFRCVFQVCEASCSAACCDSCPQPTYVDGPQYAGGTDITEGVKLCGNLTLDRYFCLGPGTHNISVDWNCRYSNCPTSGVQVTIDNQNRCSPPDEYCE